MSPIDKPLPPPPPVPDAGSAKPSSELDLRPSMPSPLSTIAEDFTPSSKGKTKDKGKANWKGKGKARADLPLQPVRSGAGPSGPLSPGLTPPPTVPASTLTAAAPLPSPITNLPTPITTESATTPSGADSASLATARKHNTVAQMYFIFGLPKTPSMWLMTEDDSIQGTTHAEGALNRFWRPEVLGCSVSSTHSPGSEKGKMGKYLEVTNADGQVDRALTSKVTIKALKLSFTREVEVMAGSKPPASLHLFNTHVPTEPIASQSPGLGHTRSLPLYGSVLTVWSAADEQRFQTIQSELTKDTDEPIQGSLFIPYTICVVSVYPLYNVLGDLNKAAWLLHSRNMDQHHLVMQQLLDSPAPSPAWPLILPGPQDGMKLSARMPLPLPPHPCWGNDATASQLALNCDLPIWPFFKTLGLENILTIVEVALSTSGKVLFSSVHESLLSLSVATVRTLVALRKWDGAVHLTCHARDARFHCADPGSWLIGVQAQVVPTLQLTQDVCLVDLDTNSIFCTAWPEGAPSRDSLRTKRMNHLYAAFPESMKRWNRQAPAQEVCVAYPLGAFRPLSQFEGGGHEPLIPPGWWNPAAVFSALDAAFRETSRSSRLRSLLSLAGLARVSKTVPNPRAESDANVRTKIEELVDTQDMLESRIGRLHKRLVLLLNESDTWRERVGEIQSLVLRLTQEATGLRERLELERKKSMTLSTALTQRDMEHVALQARLNETEKARDQAQDDLERMRITLEELSVEREAVVREMRALLDGPQDVALLSLASYEPSMPHQSSQSSLDAQPVPAQATTSAPAEQVIPPLPNQSTSSNDSLPLVQRSSSAEDDPHTETYLTCMSMVDSSLSRASVSYEGRIQTEVEKRTEVVADQIARIQSQLEQTLAQLQAKRTSLSQRASSRGSYRRRSDVSSVGLSEGIRQHSGSSSCSQWVADPGHSLGHGSATSTVPTDPNGSLLDRSFDHSAFGKRLPGGFDPVESIEDDDF